MVLLLVVLILFEGSLSLWFGELCEIGWVVCGLVSYGVVVGLLMLVVVVYLLVGLIWDVVLLFGVFICVIGLMVIVLMLCMLWLNVCIVNILCWEGIVIDLFGVLFVVLIYEVIVLC